MRGSFFFIFYRMDNTFITHIKHELRMWNQEDSTRYKQLFHHAEAIGIISFYPTVTCGKPREADNFIRRIIGPDDMDCLKTSPEQTILNLMRKYGIDKCL